MDRLDEMRNWINLMESTMDQHRPAFAADHREAPEEVIPLMNECFRVLGTEFELDFDARDQLQLYLSNSTDESLPIRFNPQSYVHTFVDQVNAALGRATGGDWLFEDIRSDGDHYIYVFRSADNPVMPGEVDEILQRLVYTDR